MTKTEIESLSGNEKQEVTFICDQCNKESTIKLYAWKKHPMICFKCNMSNTLKSKAQSTPKKPVSEETRQKLRDSWAKRDKKSIIEKTKQTNKERYGVENVSQLKESKEKAKKTNLLKYGVEHQSQSQVVKDKVRSSVMNHYGDWANRPCYEKAHQKFLNQRKQQSSDLGFIWLDEDKFCGKYGENGPIEYHFKCLKCGNTFIENFHSGVPICRTCTPYYASVAENDIVSYISSIYSGKVVVHDRKVLNGKELDIYLPELNIAIEYNGTYWHGYRKDTKLSLGEFKKKVEEKRLLCKEKGIRLINIDECDYQDRPEVYKRFFEDLVLPRKKIFARKCIIKEIDTQTAKDFCNYYHVNGFRGGSEKYGMFYNEELIMVAIFAKHPKYKYECIRLCYKTGYDITGGWAKMVSHFGRQFLHYVNLKYFDGENKTGCGYRFWLHNHVYYRNQLQKKELSHVVDSFDPNLSDFQNCLINNGIAIFDVGNDIRIYNQEN